MSQERKRKRIAIIDDSTPFCLLVKQIFDDVYEVHAYHTATDFTALTSRASEYDLILLDINLPDTDGLELLSKLKALTATRHIPILMLTGDSRKDTVIRGMKLGASDYMVKPIDPLQLEDRVCGLLGDKSPEAEG